MIRSDIVDKKLFTKNFIVVLLCFLIFGLDTQNDVLASTTTDISFYGKLENARNVNYWIDANCEYTVSIPNAAQLLTYPDGMSNRLNLYLSTDKSSSCIEFYQYSLNDNINAFTSVF